MCKRQIEPDGSRYEIKLKGRLDESWADWFEGFTFTYDSNGTTILTGEIIDQVALHGLLKRIRDWGMPLLSVNQIRAGQDRVSDREDESEQSLT